MNATDILKRKGLKKSAQRIRVINILKDKGMPMAEDEIKVAMGEIYDRVTFYRTMQALEKAGVVHRILIDNNKSEYAFNVEDGHHSHVHFLCTKCGAVSCLNRLPEGYVPAESEVLIKGVCPSCSAEKK